MSERLFLGIALDDPVRHGLAAFLDQKIGSRLPGRRVPPQNWHVTVRFLGATEARRRDLLLARLDVAPLGEPFVLGFGSIGAFPRPSRATVVWLGIGQGREELETVAASCEEVAVAVGFRPEDRPFHPHATLSRVRPPEDVGSLTGSMPRFPLTQRVDEVTLFRSFTERGGARYEVVDRLPLGA